AEEVLADDGDGRIDRGDLERLEIDQVAEVPLQRGLGRELQRRCQLGAVGREHHLQQAAAEVGAVDALAGRGEEQLLDHVADVIVISRRRRPAPPLEVKRKNDVDPGGPDPYIAVTRVCVTVISSGVPDGAQIAWLSSSTSGWPFDVTRVDPVTHCAVTHGPLPPGGGGSAHPATTYGAVIVTVGWPLTVTRGL